MASAYRKRRVFAAIVALLLVSISLLVNQPVSPVDTPPSVSVPTPPTVATSPAIEVLASLEVKGRAPKTDYSREQFGSGWLNVQGCDMRNIILNRDLTDPQIDEMCHVTSGTLNDPYTGKIIVFTRGSATSADVQIDHVVALSDAWQKGAQNLSKDVRIRLANDALELLAVDGVANQQKSDGDAATWLPSNKAFRCQYIARQIAVKHKYDLWVTQAEHDAMLSVLTSCPAQALPAA